jgi:hypothetical protein
MLRGTGSGIGHTAWRPCASLSGARTCSRFCGAGDRARHRVGSGPCDRSATGCTEKYPIRSARCGTSRPSPAVLDRWRHAGSVAPVCQQGTRLGELRQQRPRPDVVRGLSCRKKHLDRTALRVGQDVQFRVQPALGPTDQPSAPPFFTARLEAVRCAFRWVASIITISVSCACEASSVMMVANTPMRLHRFQRL